MGCWLQIPDIRDDIMGKIFLLLGKSASGKDGFYERLLKSETLRLEKIVLYTTRPMRADETDGMTYHFVDEETFFKFKRDGRLIEERSYQTVQGLWRYFTADDGQIHLEKQDYITIGTLEAYEKMKTYFGDGVVCPIYVEVEDGERLSRALSRERKQDKPDYAELCRRFLADREDFSEEKLYEAGIRQRFVNDERDRCLTAIESYIRSVIY